MSRGNGRPSIPVTIDGQEAMAYEGETILDVATRIGVRIPRLCYLEGLSVWGGCRLCLVEVEDDPRYRLSCATPVVAEMAVTTTNWELHNHRRRIVEMLFAEGNHICAVCVSNGDCELQDLAAETDVDHIHYDLQHPDASVDASHPKYVLDRERCVLCTRCVRVCNEIEGAHVWDVGGRGSDSKIVAELSKPWGESPSCTWCGKCVLVCPTGALAFKGRAVGEMRHDPAVIDFLKTARDEGKWYERQEAR